MNVLHTLALWTLLLPVKLYRWLVSPWMPRVCRFHPSCSRYSHDALLKHGAFKGGALMVKRIARCHPFHPGGLDPVP